MPRIASFFILAVLFSSRLVSAAESPRIIGEPNNGCIAGAASLPLEGAGYMVMHLERKRHYGHPRLIDTLTALAHEVKDRGGYLRIGDLSMERGGPMPSGHRSHQTGLDADVWFDLQTAPYPNLNPLRSNVSASSLLTPAKNALDARLWSDRHVSTLKAAALRPGVDRIFVNPHIKRELCRMTAPDKAWLHKIRPWYNHDDHFHLRLACPENNPDCIRQAPVPQGDGCDDSLAWWFEEHPPEPAKPAVPKPPLPAACVSLLKSHP